MDKKLQIEVMENLSQNGGWLWTNRNDTLLGMDKEAPKKRQETSRYSVQEYFRCTRMLIEDGKVIARDSTDNRGNVRKWDPLDLSISGHEYLQQLKHPLCAWSRKNWFAVAIAFITFATAIASIVVQIVLADCPVPNDEITDNAEGSHLLPSFMPSISVVKSRPPPSVSPPPPSRTLVAQRTRQRFARRGGVRVSVVRANCAAADWAKRGHGLIALA